MPIQLIFLVLMQLTIGCKALPTGSDVKITNAEETSDYPAVFGLTEVGADDPFCTATAIGPNVAINKQFYKPKHGGQTSL